MLLQHAAMPCQGFIQPPTCGNPIHSLTTSYTIPLENSTIVISISPKKINVTKLKQYSQGISLHSLRKRGLMALAASLGTEDSVTRSGTSARQRRLEKLQEERKRRETEKEKKMKEYPEWAKVIENACKHDTELREIIGDAIGNPELMRKRIAERGRRKGRDVSQPRTGSLVAVNVVFRDFNPTDSYIWMELYGSASDKDVDFIGGTIRSWYVLGRLGAFNSMNLQLTEQKKSGKLSYNVDHASKALTSSFHDISDVEFQDNLCRFWVDMGTSDVLALDILINALMGLSADYVGIKHLVFGGKRFGDWEEGMTSAEFGYKKFKI